LVESRGETGRGKCAAHASRGCWAIGIGFIVPILILLVSFFSIAALNKLGIPLDGD
jgi:hypothetical protein